MQHAHVATGTNTHEPVNKSAPTGLGDDIEARIRAHNSRTLLRFVMCGSVDDGKSTLIGRLLYESGSLLLDQIAALEADSRAAGTQGEELDFALLLDGWIWHRSFSPGALLGMGLVVAPSAWMMAGRTGE